jgi:hypothetical protein
MISNAKGDLARAAAEAKKAQESKAEMEALAAAQTEFDRLYVQFGAQYEEIYFKQEDIKHYEKMMEEDQTIDYTVDIEAIRVELEPLTAKWETEGAAFIKAKKILDDLVSAKQKRIESEENARRQAELEA